MKPHNARRALERMADSSRVTLAEAQAAFAALGVTLARDSFGDYLVTLTRAPMPEAEALPDLPEAIDAGLDLLARHSRAAAELRRLGLPGRAAALSAAFAIQGV